MVFRLKDGRLIGLRRQTGTLRSHPIVPLRPEPKDQTVVELKDSHLVDNSEDIFDLQPYWIQKTGIDIHRLGTIFSTRVNVRVDV